MIRYFLRMLLPEKKLSGDNATLIANVTCLQVACFLGALIHVLFLLIFFAGELYGMSGLEVLHVATFLGSIFLFHKKKYQISFYVLYFNVLLFNLLYTYILGGDANFYLYCFVGHIIVLTTTFLSSQVKIVLLFTTIVSTLVVYKQTNGFHDGAYPIEGLTGLFGFINLISFFFFCFVYFYLLQTYNEQVHEIAHQDKALATQMATTDQLTQLGNRYSLENYKTFLMEYFSQGILAALMIDIDNFKRVNDTYGHYIGDVVLTDIAKLINESLNDIYYGFRFGGEEMVVLSHKVSGAQLSAWSEELCNKIRALEFESTTGGTFQVTVTCGYSYGLGKDLDAIVKEADMALYYGKQTGKNKIVAYKDIQRQGKNV